MTRTTRRTIPIRGKWHVMNFDPSYASEFKARYRVSYESYYSRDGKSGWGKQKRKFKERCKKDIRSKNKRFCIKVIKGGDYENTAQPSTQDCKRFIWDYF